MSKRIALYDLAKMPTTNDFVTWIVIARTLGAEHVHFIHKNYIGAWKYDAATAWKRFANILLPVCEIAGLPFTVSDERVDGFECGYTFGEAIKINPAITLFRLDRNLYIEPFLEPYVTVTLRDSLKSPERNSDKSIWTSFCRHLSKYISVVVLNETDTAPAPVTLKRRFQWYSYSKMNFSVNTGPMALCYFSNAPYCTVNMVPFGVPGDFMRSYLKATGFPEGSQFPCADPATQRLVWQPQSLDLLKQQTEELLGIPAQTPRKAAHH